MDQKVPLDGSNRLTLKGGISERKADGKDLPDSVQFVAEVSSNHHGSLERCVQFIECAARIGCDAVKFQLFRVDELFAPEILAASQSHRERQAWELPDSFLEPLARECRNRQIRFGCTPFHLTAVERLEPLVDFFKIASYELLWHPLLEACAATGKPLVVSTGMAELDEVADAVRALTKSGCSDLTLLHCVSGYPTPAGESNLRALETLRDAFGAIPGLRLGVGWSDHSVERAVVDRAVHRFGACMIEFHLDLDGHGEEFDRGHCWLPQAMETLIRDVHLSQHADGDGQKRAAPCEVADRAWRADPGDGLRPLRSTRTGYRP